MDQRRRVGEDAAPSGALRRRSREISIAALPTDILAIVFSFIPIDPRLKVVSRVCKQWHNAVLRSVDTVPLHWAGPSSPLPLLPSVTSLELDSAMPVRDYPTDLRALHLHSRGALSPQLFSALTSLTCDWRLDFCFSVATDSWPFNTLASLLSNNYNTLCSLTLRAHLSREPPSMPELYLPALTSLRVDSLDQPAILQSLLRNCASQLRELDWTCEYREKRTLLVLGDTLFPQLDFLALSGSSSSLRQALLQGTFLTHSPLRSGLQISLSYVGSKVECFTLPGFTARLSSACIYRSAPADAANDLSLLAECTRLTSLKLLNEWDAAEIVAPLLTRLRCLSIRNASLATRFAHVVRTATSLTSLEVCDIAPTALSTGGSLPYLRDFHCSWDSKVHPVDRIVTFLSRCLQCFPRLDTLTVHFAFGDNDVPLVREFLEEAQRRGVREIYLLGCSSNDPSAATLRLTQGLPWLHLIAPVSKKRRTQQ